MNATGRTFLAALLGGATVSAALDLVGVLHWHEVVGARVVRAERLAALVHLTLSAGARHLPRARDGRESTGAPDGVAEHLRNNLGGEGNSHLVIFPKQGVSVFHTPSCVRS